MFMHSNCSEHHAVLRRKQAGFSLIELMVTVAIVAILMGIAIPSYTRYTTEQGRSDGQAGILLLASQLEKFKTACGSYLNANNIDTGSPVPAAGCTGLGLRTATSPEGRYTLSVALNATSTTYTITATPLGVQAARDTDCGNLTYRSDGLKGQSGPNAGGRCWRK